MNDNCFTARNLFRIYGTPSHLRTEKSMGAQNRNINSSTTSGESMGVEAENYEVLQHLIQLCVTSSWLCNELYLQLIKQTTDHPGKAGSSIFIISSAFQSRKFRCGNLKSIGSIFAFKRK